MKPLPHLRIFLILRKKNKVNLTKQSLETETESILDKKEEEVEAKENNGDSGY